MQLPIDVKAVIDEAMDIEGARALGLRSLAEETGCEYVVADLATASGARPTSRQTHPRRGPCVLSRARIACAAAPGVASLSASRALAPDCSRT